MSEDHLVLFEGESKYQRVNLELRLIDFSLKIDKLTSQLPSTKLCDRITDQMVRSSSSVAFNYGEAQSAESRNDFIHKMKVCLKELRECFVGLKFIKRGNFKFDQTKRDELHSENNELISIFVSSIKTARRNK
jgi:four helix bundle protein